MSLPDDPFEEARLRARAAGTCPVGELGAFYAEHASADELCGMFACRECAEGGRWPAADSGNPWDPGPGAPAGEPDADPIPF